MNTSSADYIPFDVSQYERQTTLSNLELTILSNRSYRSDWCYLQSEIPGLMRPLIDLATHRQWGFHAFSNHFGGSHSLEYQQDWQTPLALD